MTSTSAQTVIQKYDPEFSNIKNGDVITVFVIAKVVNGTNNNTNIDVKMEYQKIYSTEKVPKNKEVVTEFITKQTSTEDVTDSSSLDEISSSDDEISSSDDD